MSCSAAAPPISCRKRKAGADGRARIFERRARGRLQPWCNRWRNWKMSRAGGGPSSSAFSTRRGLARRTQDDVPPTQPTLSDMVRRGIELLQFHRGGYLLVVDATSMRQRRTAPGDREMAGGSAGIRSRNCGGVGIYGREICDFRLRRCGGRLIVRTPRASSRHRRPTGERPTFHSGSLPNVCEPGRRRGFVPSAFDSPGIRTRRCLRTGDIVTGRPVRPRSEETRIAGRCPGVWDWAWAPTRLHGTLDNTAIFEIIRDNL